MEKLLILISFCVLIEICREVRPVSNGKVTYTGYLVGDTVKYQCNNGYTMYGPMKRRCLASGKWTGKNTKCESE